VATTRNQRLEETGEKMNRVEEILLSLDSFTTEEQDRIKNINKLVGFHNRLIDVDGVELFSRFASRRGLIEQMKTSKDMPCFLLYYVKITPEQKIEMSSVAVERKDILHYCEE
jgi:hypothetical protein